ncbi:single-stranded DNA-binding protein [Corynebacterium cystitidis]|uniref:Single-stranded DNA-binding protein n=1 Tax=Corynebacterium cystitidis DSM 20524 TaxID=1121357 RepID=A0A1H9UYT3_9CORY|nr:single-stranded DNA-binding protein [Corynebacterium cystitidis]WJY83631.1 Single-stranded DNA-binding protein [Corynebacterium cystitidis DSM 20524]SES14586.1 single-strand DNA-binding protein [Corynebacterium cystitidis DSM 20524]SNV91637.1 ssDNA-binding protein [Corynebacterium cystitidis]
MAQGDTPITLVGNLTADPELRFTPSGAAVANFTVASTPRQYNRDSGQWEDGEAMFLDCSVWRQAAENVAESMSKGMRVIVTGRLRQRSFTNRDGEKRTVFEVDVDEVGPSLRWASATVNRNPREGGSGGNWGGGNRGGGQQQSQGGFGGQQPGQNNQGGFGQQAPQHGSQQSQQSGGQQSGGQQVQQPANDPWNSAPPAGGFGGGMDDEPPF